MNASDEARDIIEQDRHLALLAAIICAGRLADGYYPDDDEEEAEICVKLASAIKREAAKFV